MSLKEATLAPSLKIDVFEVERVDVSRNIPWTNDQSGLRVKLDQLGNWTHPNIVIKTLMRKSRTG